MYVKGFLRMRRDGDFEHVNLIVLEEHLMVPGRRRDSIEVGPPMQA